MQQILDVFCSPAPAPEENPSEASETFKPEKRGRKKPVKGEKNNPPMQVYTDEQGMIHARPHPNPVPDPAPTEGACSSGGDACESSDNETELGTIDEAAEEELLPVRKRGRPRGSRNIGITALKRQNPNLRLGEKELGYCCAIDGCAVRLRSRDNIEYHRRCHSDGEYFLYSLNLKGKHVKDV